MISYIIRRLLLMIPTLIGVTAVAFFVMAYSPGGVAGSLRTMGEETQAEDGGRDAVMEYYNRRYGLDKPKWQQYLRWLNMISPVGREMNPDGTLGDFKWLKVPDLGRSYSRNRNVLALYAEALPVTILLNVITLPIVFLLPILAGIYAARHRGGVFDYASGVTFLGLWSLPNIWVGVMLIGYLANEQYLRLFPVGGLSSTGAREMPFLPGFTEAGAWVSGWLLDRLWHLVLPVVCLSYAGLAFLSKLTRASMLESLSADFVRTARAKGVEENRILFHHVLRNSLLPLITVAAGIIPGLLAGSVIVETIFSIPGMGKLTIDAINARDRELVLAGVLIGGIIGLLSQLVRDIAYAIADPRVSYD